MEGSNHKMLTSLVYGISCKHPGIKPQFGVRRSSVSEILSEVRLNVVTNGHIVDPGMFEKHRGCDVRQAR